MFLNGDQTYIVYVSISLLSHVSSMEKNPQRKWLWAAQAVDAQFPDVNVSCQCPLWYWAFHTSSWLSQTARAVCAVCSVPRWRFDQHRCSFRRVFWLEVNLICKEALSSVGPRFSLYFYLDHSFLPVLSLASYLTFLSLTFFKKYNYTIMFVKYLSLFTMLFLNKSS